MIGSGLIYIFGLTLGKMILELPFSIYSTFWIEVKYGFNRTTPWTFVKDRLKGLGLMLALGVPLLALVLFFFQKTGSNAWLYVWLSLSIFEIVLFLVSPVVILPIFLKMLPLPNGSIVKITEINGVGKGDLVCLKRIYYEVAEGWNGAKAFKTADQQFKGSPTGDKVSIRFKEGVWELIEGDLEAESPVVYARSVDVDAKSPESTRWKLITPSDDSQLTDEKSCFEMVRCDVGGLRADLLALAKKLEYICDKIFLIDGSTRSDHSNAFCVGFGRFKRICLYDTLLGRLDSDEIVAVLAHEIGHDKKRHTLTRIGESLALSFVQFYFLGLFISNQTLANVFFMKEPKTYVGLLLFVSVWGTVEAFLNIPLTIQSRSFEYQADRFSIDANVDYAEKLSSGLMKLMRSSKANLTPHPVKVFLDFSHPPMLLRNRAIADYKMKKWGKPFTPPVLNKEKLA